MLKTHRNIELSNSNVKDALGDLHVCYTKYSQTLRNTELSYESGEDALGDLHVLSIKC